MREIKFRAWNTEEKEFDDGDFVIGINLNGEALYDGPDDLYPNIIFQQYTGLKDKNGKEIYEKDIIKYKGMKTPQLIGFGSGRYCFVYETGEPMRNITPNEMLKMEIIGNIYENPELMK